MNLTQSKKRGLNYDKHQTKPKRNFFCSSLSSGVDDFLAFACFRKKLQKNRFKKDIYYLSNKCPKQPK